MHEDNQQERLNFDVGWLVGVLVFCSKSTKRASIQTSSESSETTR